MSEARHGFEGSYLGANDRISPRAIMECKICWTTYDPAEGDDYRQVLPGTPFVALPEDWTCPGCDAPKAQFIVREDPGSDEMRKAALIGAATARLVADFREVYHSKMRDVPVINQALHVEAVGFRAYDGCYLGVLIAPWFMNLVLLPGEDADWPVLKPGEKEVISFPSGDYEFLHNSREMVGPYKACSLFSPMADSPVSCRQSRSRKPSWPSCSGLKTAIRPTAPRKSAQPVKPQRPRPGRLSRRSRICGPRVAHC